MDGRRLVALLLMMAAASGGPVSAIAAAVQRAQAAFEGTARDLLQKTSQKKMKPGSQEQEDVTASGKRGAASSLSESDSRVLEAVKGGLGSCLAELYAGFDAAVVASSSEIKERMDGIEKHAASVDNRLQAIEENGILLVQTVQKSQTQIAETHEAVKLEVQKAISSGAVKVEIDETKVDALTKLCEANAEKIKTLEEKAAAAPTLPPGLATQSTQGSDSQSVSSSAADLPYEQRVLAMLGQVVPYSAPLPKAQLVNKAEQLLVQARIPPDWIRAGPFAITRDGPGGGRVGNAVEILFCKPEQLRISKCKIRDLEIRNEDGKFLWLDARRTKAENAPARYIHKMGDLLTDYLQDNSISVNLQKDVKKSTIANNNVIMVTLLAARPKPCWKWSADFCSSVTEEQRKDFETAVGCE